MGRKECSVKCEVWRKQWEVKSVKCGVWSVKFQFGVRRVQCEVWSVRFGVWRKQWEVRSVKCGVWSLKFGVRRVQCEVWSVECEDFASSLAEKIKRLSREGHGRDRVSLNYRSFMFGKLPPPACPGLCYELINCNNWVVLQQPSRRISKPNRSAGIRTDYIILEGSRNAVTKTQNQIITKQKQNPNKKQHAKQQKKNTKRKNRHCEHGHLNWGKEMSCTS